MAGVGIRRMGELLRGVFEILMTSPEPVRAKAVLRLVEDRLPPTPHEQDPYPSGGGRRYEKLIRFSTVDTVKAGWLVKSKGGWELTDEGRRAFEEFQDPGDFYREANRLYRRWKAAQASDDDVAEVPSDEEIDSEAEQVRQTYEEAEEHAWQEIQEHLRRLSPYDFQSLVAALLRAMSYHVAWVAPPGKDGGVDILAWSDPIGTRPPRIKVQVKRRQESANVDALRSFIALLGDGDVGLFVSMGGFTRDAEELARSQERRQVTLVTLERLFDLWVEFYDKVKEQDRALLPLRPIYYLAPRES